MIKEYAATRNAYPERYQQFLYDEGIAQLMLQKRKILASAPIFSSVITEENGNHSISAQYPSEVYTALASIDMAIEKIKKRDYIDLFPDLDLVDLK